jgi:hypothetical protein
MSNQRGAPFMDPWQSRLFTTEEISYFPTPHEFEYFSKISQKIKQEIDLYYQNQEINQEVIINL